MEAARVDVPFLSALGAQEGAVWQHATREWRRIIASEKKRLVVFEADTEADAHRQGSSPLLLAQEVDAWLRDVL